MMINSGSTDNLVSEEVVKKLKLRRVPHRNPYKVSLLTKNQQTIIEEQAWVEFQLGK